MSHTLGSFARDRQGSVAIVFALSLIALSGVSALAVDYARMLRAQQRLQVLADSAALAGARALEQGGNEARVAAEAYISQQTVRDVTNVQTNIDVDSNTVRVRTRADMPTSFARVIGYRDVRLTAMSQTLREKNYLDVHVVLDMSGSMGLAATAAEMARFKAITKPMTDAGAAVDAWLAAENGCAFACHQMASWNTNGKTAFQIARENNILLRWDVLLDAARTMSSSLLSTAHASSKNIRIGAFAFSESVEKLSDPTDNLSAIQAAFLTSTILRRDTLSTSALRDIKGRIGPSGNGFSSGSPRKMIVIATDGVQGGNHGPTGAGDSVFDKAVCDEFKANGVDIAIIEVKYLQDGLSPATETRMRPLYPLISPALQDCASGPDLFLQADNAAQIRDAFATMAQRIIDRGPQITN